MCEEMKAMREIMAAQQNLLVMQLSAERQRASDLEAELREYKVKHTQTLLTEGMQSQLGARPGSLDKLGELPRSGGKHTTLRGGGPNSLSSLDNGGKPMLYQANWKQMALFKGLGESNMHSMIKKMKVRSFKEGETIVKHGTIGTTMFFLDLGGAKAIVGDTVAQFLTSGESEQMTPPSACTNYKQRLVPEKGTRKSAT